MTDSLVQELAQAREARLVCALVTIAATKGSVPRAAGSKMLVYADGKCSGTIGGGKFEALVKEEALQHMSAKEPLLKTYPLHENSPQSFGAICGGEATVLIEPQSLGEAIFLVGGGHCAQAIARLAVDCGLFVTLIEDRGELTSGLPAQAKIVRDKAPSDVIRGREWKTDEALIMVSRNYEIDREALAAAMEMGGAGYIGMIGSRRKVQQVFEELRERGVTQTQLDKVYAPLGLDIGADAPAEIAVSVVAEVLAVMRGRSAKHFREGK
jgi:xanthine dehydrogenase accessory factor